jgi:hypothetical protein
MKTLHTTFIAIFLSIATQTTANTTSFEMQTVSGVYIEVITKEEALIQAEIQYHYNMLDGHVYHLVLDLAKQEQPLESELNDLDTKAVFDRELKDNNLFVLDNQILQNFTKTEKEVEESGVAAYAEWGK